MHWNCAKHTCSYQLSSKCFRFQLRTTFNFSGNSRVDEQRKIFSVHLSESCSVVSMHVLHTQAAFPIFVTPPGSSRCLCCLYSLLIGCWVVTWPGSWPLVGCWARLRPLSAVTAPAPRSGAQSRWDPARNRSTLTSTVTSIRLPKITRSFIIREEAPTPSPGWKQLLALSHEFKTLLYHKWTMDVDPTHSK